MCVVFAVLRSLDANMALSATIRDFSHSVGARLGPYLMLAAMVVFGAAVAGLLLFRGGTLHPTVRWAAVAIVLLALLGVAQSTSLHLPVVFLQATVGPATVSRIIEGLLLASLAACAAWYIRDAKSRGVVRY